MRLFPLSSFIFIFIYLFIFFLVHVCVSVCFSLAAIDSRLLWKQTKKKEKKKKKKSNAATANWIFQPAMDLVSRQFTNNLLLLTAFCELVVVSQWLQPPGSIAFRQEISTWLKSGPYGVWLMLIHLDLDWKITGCHGHWDWIKQLILVGTQGEAGQRVDLKFA